MGRNAVFIYVRASLIVILAFALANPLTCTECLAATSFIPAGVPFAFLKMGGFQSVHQTLWLGAALDVVTVFGIAVLLGWAWNRWLVK